jgi:peptidoglycan/LPS O-acetylase OafA/YrhL
MAWFRFALAIEVVCFHTGMGQISGPVAVIAFFVLSGFLIARVLTENYLARDDGAWSGAGRFYANRVLRLAPGFLVVSLAMMIVCVGAQHAPLDLRPNELPEYASSIAYSGHALHTYIYGVEPHFALGWSPVPHVFASFVWIPQYWTVAFEALFYALAPLLIALTLKSGRWVFAAAFAVALAFYVWATAKAWGVPALGDMLVYRNGLSMFVFFFWGAGLYAISRATTWRFPLRVAMAVAVVYLLAIGGAWYVRDSFAQSWILSTPFWHIVTVLALVPIVLCAPVPRRFTHVDRYLGDLSYGIYISHFVAITLLRLPAAHYAADHHVAIATVPMFGTFDASPLVFRLATIALAILIAVAVLHLVERPVERLRRRLGSRRPDGGAVAPEHDAQGDERPLATA